MKKCNVCGNTVFKRRDVDEIFHLEDQMVLVESIPANICTRCNEATFDRQTVENIRQMVHGGKRPKKHVNVDVFAYA